MEHLLSHDNVLLIFRTFRSTVLCFHKKQCSRKEEKYDSGYPDVYAPKSLGSQSVVPIKDAPFPQISIRPKYSPERSGGTIFAK